jgi:hypothetical protein
MPSSFLSLPSNIPQPPTPSFSIGNFPIGSVGIFLIVIIGLIAIGTIIHGIAHHQSKPRFPDKPIGKYAPTRAFEETQQNLFAVNKKIAQLQRIKSNDGISEEEYDRLGQELVQEKLELQRKLSSQRNPPPATATSTSTIFKNDTSKKKSNNVFKLMVFGIIAFIVIAVAMELHVENMTIENVYCDVIFNSNEYVNNCKGELLETFPDGTELPKFSIDEMQSKYGINHAMITGLDHHDGTYSDMKMFAMKGYFTQMDWSD